MKKKLIMLSLALISCVCVAVGFSACSNKTDDDPDVAPTTEHTHTLTAVAAVAATCEDAGNTAYWYCADCGKYYSDANATTEISLSSTVIAALGHDYETTFSWDFTNEVASASATRVCANDSTHTETVTCTLVEDTSSTVAATCTTAGSVTYTATATFSDNSTETDTKTFYPAAIGHSYATTLSKDATYHWYAATCEHTSEVSGKAEHTFAYNSTTGKYVCSECGYEITNLIADSTDTLIVGVNHIYLASNSTEINFAFSADKDGTYTFTVDEGCKASVYVDDIYGNTTTLGASSAETNTYTVSLEMDETYSFSIFITGYDDYTIEDYYFCLNIGCVEGEVAAVGESSSNPYAMTELSSSNYYDVDTSIAGSSSYYFTVTAASADTLAQIYYLPDSSLELCDEDGNTLTTTTKTVTVEDVNGTEEQVTYTCYYFLAGTTGTSFSLKNNSTEAISKTINCETWSPSISGSETVAVSASWLDSNNSITYSYTPTETSTTYSVTLGTDNDSNIAVYAYNTSGVLVQVLGNGSEETEYRFTSRSGNLSDVYFVITYVGTPSGTTFNLDLDIEKYVDTSGGTTLTLSEAAYATISGTSNSVTYNYTPETSGIFVITLSSTYSNWSNLAKYNSVSLTLDDTTVYGAYGVFAVSLTAGTAHKFVITVSSLGSNEITLSTTISSSYETLTVSETAQTVYGGKVYIFIASADGSYSFTVDEDSDIYVTDGTGLYGSGTTELSYNGYGESNNGMTTTKTLSEGDILYLFCYNDNYTGTVTITEGEAAEDPTEEAYVFGSTITLTSAEYQQTVTFTEAGDYIIILTFPDEGTITASSYNTTYGYLTFYIDKTYNWNNYVVSSDGTYVYVKFSVTEEYLGDITFNINVTEISKDILYYAMIDYDFVIGQTITLSEVDSERVISISEAGTYTLTFTFEDGFDINTIDSGTFDFTYTIGEDTYDYNDWSIEMGADYSSYVCTITVDDACDIVFNFALYLRNTSISTITYYATITAAE